MYHKNGDEDVSFYFLKKKGHNNSAKTIIFFFFFISVPLLVPDLCTMHNRTQQIYETALTQHACRSILPNSTSSNYFM